MATRPYQPQVDPASGSPAPALAGPGAFGGAVGQGIEVIGNALDQRERARIQFERGEQNASAGLGYQGALAVTEDYRRLDADGSGEGATPDGSGHQQRVLAKFHAERDAVLDGIADARTRAHWQEIFAEYERGLTDRTFTTEMAKRSASTVAGFEKSVTVASNQLSRATTPAEVGGVLDGIDALVDGSNLPDDQKEKLRTWGRSTAKGAFADGLIDRDPEQFLKLAEAGGFDDISPDKLDSLRDNAHSAIRARESAARAEQAHAQAQAKEGLATTKALLDTGAGTPADWEKLAQGYEAVGDTSAAVEARAKGGEMAAVQGSRDYTVPQMQAEIAKLDAKANGKGGLTPGEATLRSGLQTQLAQSQARLGQSGGALQQYQYATGKPLPAIDPNNPASMRQRSSYAATAAQRYGLNTVEPLLESELPGLRQQMGGGPAQKMQVLDVLAGFGDARAIEGAARQLSTAGSDGGFRIAATYVAGPGGRQIARDILNGPDALKSHPQLVNRQEANAIFDRFAPSLMGLGADFAADTREAAISLYAARMSAQGLTAWSPAEFKNSVDAAMGGVHDGPHYKGGTWTFKDQRVMIPQGWTAEGVFRRIARMNGEDLGKARVSGAGVWPDGSPIYTGQLREMIPVYLGGTRYGFRSPSGSRLLPDDRGGVFTLDVAKVPWR